MPTVIQPTDTRKIFTPEYSVANTITLNVSGSSKTLNWTGLTNGVWDVKNTVNWNDAVIDDQYFNGDTVNFGNGPANRTITLTGLTVTPEAINVNNNAGNDYTIGGTGGIGGRAALTKDGAGTLILTGNNSHTGATTINEGTLQIGDGGALGETAITNNATLAIDRSDTSTLTGSISEAGGARSVTKTGPSALVLSGTNQWSGPTQETAACSISAASRLTSAGSASAARAPQTSLAAAAWTALGALLCQWLKHIWRHDSGCCRWLSRAQWREYFHRRNDNRRWHAEHQ